MEGPESQYQSSYPKESLVKRYKLIWRILLISNLGLGSYMFARARTNNFHMGDSRTAKKDEQDIPAAGEDFLDSATTLSISETPFPAPEVAKPKELIPEDQQHELFK